MSALAELLGFERTALTRSAALLERNGWVTPAQSEDARECPLLLTRTGRRKLVSAFLAWKAAQDLIDRGGAEYERAPASTQQKPERRFSERQLPGLRS